MGTSGGDVADTGNSGPTEAVIIAMFHGKEYLKKNPAETAGQGRDLWFIHP